MSLAHLLQPVRLAQTEEDSEAFGYPVVLSGHPSDPTQQVFQLEASLSQVLEQPLPSVSGSTFPWARFRDYHDTQRVLVYYHPLCMDNYQYFVGPNISTLSVPGYRVSKFPLFLVSLELIQWTLTNPNSLRPVPVQISESLGLVNETL